MLTKVSLNGSVLITRGDEHGNFWIQDCPENRRALQITDAGPKAIFGSCIVGPQGNVIEARKNSITIFTIAGGAEIIWLEQILEPHEVTENVRKTIARKTFKRMQRMNVVLPVGFKVAVVPA